ncbi:MAG TPA: VWA domain-containing protein, partial [Nannocystaceae bacterium]|nr:VWA domain-containing protein [Nannocystaceae bacterium]
MTAAQPWALAALALAIPIVAAYLHRRRRLSKQVPSVLILRAIAGHSKPTKRAWSRPRHLVSLAFVLLALVGLAVALADLRDDDDAPRDYVVVLDTSASMGAGGDTTRLAEGVDMLDEALAGLRPGDRVALVTTGAQTLVRVGLTEDRERVLELARAATAAGAGTGTAGALRIADAICKGARRGAIVLVSDGVGVDVPTTTCPIEHVGVGRGGPNAGITALSVREADALGLAEIYTVITSELGRPQEIELTLKVDDDIVDVISLDLPAHGDVEKLHRVPLPSGERVTAEIGHLDDDQLAADDRATVVRHGGARVSVLLVAETRLSFAAEALRLHPRVDLRVVGPHDAI